MIPKRRNRRRSKQIVKPELRTIVETPVDTMEDTRTMSELLQAPTEGYGDAIFIPIILAENFELKLRLLQLVTLSQFHGFERDDPHSHIPQIWLEKEPSRSIHTWEDLVSNEAWDRFKDLLRKCPHRSFLELHQIDTFYNALTQSDQDSLNAAAGGNLLNRTPRDAWTIIENKSKVLSSRNKSVVSKASTTTSSAPTYLPEITALTDAVKAMLLQNKTLSPAPVKAIEEICVTYVGPHLYYECLATDGNTFNAFAATGTYNQGGPEYSAQGETNYRASNQMRPPVFHNRIGVSYDGPTIPPTFSPLPKEVKREPEATKVKVQTTNLGSTIHVQPLVVQVPIPEPDVAPKPNPKPLIPYPSRLNDQKLREKANNQMLKFLQIFQ
ncbi:hypothetical protein Tco_1223342, partial [Tanacetum coccineum]